MLPGRERALRLGFILGWRLFVLWCRFRRLRLRRLWFGRPCSLRVLLRSRLFRSCRLWFRRFFSFVFLRLCLLLRLIGFFLVEFCNQPNGLLRCRFCFRLAFGRRLRALLQHHSAATSGFGSGVPPRAFFATRKTSRRLSYPSKWRKRAPAFVSTEKFNLFPSIAAEGLLNPRSKRDRRSAMLMRAGRLKLTVTRPPFRDTSYSTGRVQSKTRRSYSACCPLRIFSDGTEAFGGVCDAPARTTSTTIEDPFSNVLRRSRPSTIRLPFGCRQKAVPQSVVAQSSNGAGEIRLHRTVETHGQISTRNFRIVSDGRCPVEGNASELE